MNQLATCLGDRVARELLPSCSVREPRRKVLFVVVFSPGIARSQSQDHALG